MKQIGIISMQRVVNHGSFLQAYGLKKTIERVVPGAVCEFIDLKMAGERKALTIYPKTFLFKMKCLGYKIFGYNDAYNEIKTIWHDRDYKSVYLNEIKKYLNITEEQNNKTNYDSVVVGSDEIFNCTQEDVWWTDPMFLFGEGVESSNIISYAASFGFTTKERLNDFNLYDRVRGNLKKFHSISVRDDNSFKLVEELTGEKPYKNIDPVLVYDFEKEVKNPNIKNYMIIYQYTNRIKDKDIINQIKEFAKKNNLKIISVFGYCAWADKNIVCTPFEAMGYIKNADFVVTDTFHGCVMATKFNRPFAAFTRDSNYNKMFDLLKTFNLQGHIIKDGEGVEDILSRDTDWDKVNSIIKEQQKFSCEYLKANL